MKNLITIGLPSKGRLKEKSILRELPIRILLLEVLQKDKPLMHQFKVAQQTLLS